MYDHTFLKSLRARAAEWLRTTADAFERPGPFENTSGIQEIGRAHV